MTLRINQETFNEAVKENMEEFDMTLEESVNATIEQYNSQGVRLYGIVTDPSALFVEDPVIKLKNTFMLEEDDNVKISLIKNLETFIGKDVAYKVACHKNGIFEMFIDYLLSSDCSTELKTEVLDFLLILIKGYPDLVTEKGMEYFISLLDDDNVETKKYGLKLILNACFKHEQNRIKFMLPPNSIEIKIVSLVEDHPNDGLLMLLCSVITVLTLDDDIRVTVPKAYVHACKLGDLLLKPLCNCLKDRENPLCLRYILKALCALTVNHPSCGLVYDEGAIEASVKILEKHRDDELLVKQCLRFFICMAGHDEAKERMMKLDLADEIKYLLNKYLHKKDNVGAALSLISKISLRSPEFGKVFFNLDLPPLIVQGLKVHQDDETVQVAGLWCIRNMCSRNPQYHTVFLSLGVEEILNRIAETSEHRAKDAKLALQELRLDVKAEEPWTGEKGDKLASYI